MLVPVKNSEDGATDKDVKLQSEQQETQKKLTNSEFQAICNPAVQAFETALQEFLKDPKVEAIDQMHMILLIDGAQSQIKIQKMVCELVLFLDRPDFYDKLCLIFSDVSHCNPSMARLLLDSSIFQKLDYSRGISFCVVLSVCDNNEEAWTEFKENYWKSEFEENKYMKILLNK